MCWQLAKLLMLIRSLVFEVVIGIIKSASHLRKETNTVIDRYIGKRLRSIRHKRSQSELTFANCLNVSPTDYQRIEAGSLRLTASDLFLLTRHLDVPLSYFFSDDGEYFGDIILEGSEMADVFHYFSNIDDEQVRSYLLKQIKFASSVF